ncbi:MAG: ArsC family (seleno)protein [Thermoanaerobaculia bacterium]|nr:ArsC family (seleno)protein [Thermoanaerobaculia bacterium]
MDAHGLEPKEKIPASRKLGRAEAETLLAGARRLIVVKGKKVSEFPSPSPADDSAVAAMLGPTGNLRAPTVRVGKTLVVGFDEDRYREVLAVA